MGRTVNSERDPLLPRAGLEEEAPLAKVTSTHGSIKWLGFHTIARRYRWVPVLGCLIIFINEAEYYVKQVATMRALEAMYCYEYYLERGDPLAELGKKIPERLCKDDWIQKSLSTSAGLIMFVRMCSAMIGAIPLGWVADKFGRKPVLVLHKVNVVFACLAWLLLYLDFPNVPIWTLYLSGTPGLIGGNYDIGAAMLFASYSDVMPSATERASLFFLTTSMQYLAETTCPAIGAWLMNLDGKGGTPEVNLLTSTVLSVLTAVVTISLFPETVHESRQAEPLPSLEESSAGPLDADVEENTESKARSWLDRRLQGLNDSVAGVGVLNIILLFVSISFAAVGIKAIDWYALVQYPVVKLHWTFPQSSGIVAMEGFLMLLHFSVFLPAINRAAAVRLGPARAHFTIMISSALLLTAGSLMMGFSNTSMLFVVSVVVYLFGEGLPTATQAYIVSLVEKSKVARVMATLSMSSILGKLLASILFPKLLGLGLDTHKDILVGLPLFVCAVMFVISAVCVGFVGYRVSKSHRKETETL